MNPIQWHAGRKSLSFISIVMPPVVCACSERKGLHSLQGDEVALAFQVWLAGGIKGSMSRMETVSLKHTPENSSHRKYKNQQRAGAVH